MEQQTHRAHRATKEKKKYDGQYRSDFVAKFCGELLYLNVRAVADVGLEDNRAEPEGIRIFKSRKRE